MKEAFRVFLQALKDTYEDIWLVLVCNLIWLLSQLLILPGPPATVALFYYANRLANGEAVDLSDFWRAMRRYWWVAWRWGILNYLLIAILVADWIFIGRFTVGASSQFVQGLYLAGLVIWLLLQIYTLPFLFEQNTPGVRQALRNGAVLLGKNIGFSVVLGLLLGLLLVAGVPLFMLSFAFGGMILASAGNHAVLNRLEAYKVRVINHS